MSEALLRLRVVELFALAGCGLAIESVARLAHVEIDALEPIIEGLIVEGLLEKSPYGGVRPTRALKARGEELLAEALRQRINAKKPNLCSCGAAITVYSKKCRTCYETDAENARLARDKTKAIKEAAIRFAKDKAKSIAEHLRVAAEKKLNARADWKARRDLDRANTKAATEKGRAERAGERAALKAAKANKLCACGKPMTSLSTICRACFRAKGAEREKSRAAERLVRAEARIADRKAAQDRKAAREELRERNGAAYVASVRKTDSVDADRRARIEERKKGGLAVKTPVALVKHPSAAPLITAPATDPSDPWARIRARTYGKPPLIASNLRQLTPEELMKGRSIRRAI